MADIPENPGDSPADTAPPDYSGFQREDLIRYSRHFVLPGVGPEGQRKLADARVLLVGAGGLGSPAALYLAAAGVGTLGIVDPDLVDLSNLQRQVLHGISQLGQEKVESARQRLWDLNPNVEVNAHPVRLSCENALEIFGDYYLVVDGSDNFPTRYLVNDACVLLKKTYVYGAVDRWSGQVSVFGTPGGPCYRCLFREPPPPGMVPSCAEAGVLGVLPGVVGSLQAMEAVKLILEVGEPLVGRLLIFDALELSFREVRLRKNDACPVCGDEPSQTGLVDYEVFCGVGPDSEEPRRQAIPQISPTEVRVLLDGSDPPLLLDVREPYEWEIGNLAPLGAMLVPYGELSGRLDEIPRGRPVVVYCHIGVRSALVAETLRGEGFQKVFNLKGGYLAWAEMVDPRLPRY